MLAKAAKWPPWSLQNCSAPLKLVGCVFHRYSELREKVLL
jgi:hypothetical protein